MYSLLNYILMITTKYNNFYEFYIGEFSMDLSIFEFINVIILLLIFLGLFIKFLIQKYGFKIFILSILKRSFFILVFCLGMSFFSDFTSCETPINKIIGGYLKPENKKKVCIALGTIAGCYVAYKYIPAWYNLVSTYTKYRQFKIDKVQYDINYMSYLKNLYEQNQLKNKKELNDTLCQNYKDNLKNSQDIINHFMANFTNIREPYGNFLKNADVIHINKFFDMFKIVHILDINAEEDKYNAIIYRISNSYERANRIFYELHKSTDIHTIHNHKDVLLEQIKLFENFRDLLNFYGSQLLPFSFKYISHDGNVKWEKTTTSVEFEADVINLYTNLDILLTKTLDSAENVFQNINIISKSPIIVKPELVDLSDQIVNFKVLIKPELNIINFPAENLTGVKFITINLGYVTFYPLFYCSNKILGTVNPLSGKVFKDAILYFIGGGFF